MQPPPGSSSPARGVFSTGRGWRGGCGARRPPREAFRAGARGVSHLLSSSALSFAGIFRDVATAFEMIARIGIRAHPAGRGGRAAPGGIRKRYRRRGRGREAGRCCILDSGGKGFGSNDRDGFGAENRPPVKGRRSSSREARRGSGRAAPPASPRAGRIMPPHAPMRPPKIREPTASRSSFPRSYSGMMRMSFSMPISWMEAISFRSGPL